MLEINRPRRDKKLASRSLGLFKGQKSEKVLNQAPETSDFMSALEEAEATRLESDLEVFVGEIMAQGERLKQRPNRQEFLRYKAMIARFLKRILKLAFKTGKTRRRDREYLYTDIIDEKLFELGHYLLLEEAETIKIAADIDEIKGLLYDSLKIIREGKP